MKRTLGIVIASLLLSTGCRNPATSPDPFAPTITSQPGSHTKNVGEADTFTVVATGLPTPAYQWRKNNLDISGATNATYVISSVAFADSGTYGVYVSNSIGNVVSDGAVLSVNAALAPPSLTVQPLSQVKTAGQSCTLSVIAAGNPTPAYQWQKNGTVITGATTSRYSVFPVSSSDSGDYTVTLTNSEGTATSLAAHLAVVPFKSIVSAGISFTYSEGNMGSYDISDSTSHQNLLSIFNDNDIRTYNGFIYVLERLGKDDIIKISGSVIADSKVAYDRNIGAAVNIQDIAFINSTKAYVTQYQSAQVVVFDPSTGAKTGASIDLSAFDAYVGTDSASPYPYMSKALYYNGKVYVACQRLHAPAGGYIQAADTSCVVVINVASDAVEGAIKLAYKNPQELSICNGKLYVAGLGKYGMNDGGVECIDLASGSNTGSIIEENALQGDIGTVIVISDTKGYAVISTPSFATEMWSFNPQTKAVGMKISGIESPCTNHFAYDGTYVYAGDRSTTTPGIVVIDPATDAKVGATKNIGLPPNSLAYLEVD
jgi:hypothetical protein